MDITTEQVLIGSLLGDGGIYYRGTREDGTRKVNFKEGHSLKQKEYLMWKLSLMKGLEFQKPWIGKAISITTLASSSDILLPYYDLFYLEGKKVLPRELINGKLDSLGLAVWIGDDGSLGYYSRIFTLATCCFSLDDHYYLVDYFQRKWGVIPRIRRARKNYRLQFNVKDTRKLIKAIGSLLPSSMQYKVMVREYTLGPRYGKKVCS